MGMLRRIKQAKSKRRKPNKHLSKLRKKIARLRRK